MHVACCLRIHCVLTDSIPVLLSLVWEIEARPRPVAQTKKIPIPLGRLPQPVRENDPDQIAAAELSGMSGDAAEALMQDIRDFGRPPKEVKMKELDRLAERNLAKSLLSGARLSDARLSNTRPSGARLSGARLSGAC